MQPGLLLQKVPAPGSKIRIERTVSQLSFTKRASVTRPADQHGYDQECSEMTRSESLAGLRCICIKTSRHLEHVLRNRSQPGFDPKCMANGSSCAVSCLDHMHRANRGLHGKPVEKPQQHLTTKQENMKHRMASRAFRGSFGLGEAVGQRPQFLHLYRDIRHAAQGRTS